MKVRREKIKAQAVFKPRVLNSSNAFSLLEMTIVLGLAAIIIAIILPSLRGFGEGNTISASTRQMLDDVAYARQTAIKNHTKVYMVFLQPQFWTNLIPNDSSLGSFTVEGKREIELLTKGQYTSYALFSFHTMGDQPGQESPRYLTKWRELPDGSIIETNKFERKESFADVIDPARVFNVYRFNYRDFPFPPSELSNTNTPPPGLKWKMATLPYIAFDSQGSLFNDLPYRKDNAAKNDPNNIPDNEDELIPIARGSIFYPTLPGGAPDLTQGADVVETGYREATRINYNIIRIDRLTGRPKLEQPELK